jgi:hypothetical protein
VLRRFQVSCAAGCCSLIRITDITTCRAEFDCRALIWRCRLLNAIIMVYDQTSDAKIRLNRCATQLHSIDEW